jgi:hypothetical protein
MIWHLFFFFCGMEFELTALHLLGRHSTTWVTLTALFCVGCVQDRVLWTICLGWLWTVTLLISTSWVARFTGVSHWCPVVFFFFFKLRALSSCPQPFFCFFLRQSLYVKPRLVSNSQTSSLSLLNARITGMHHHTQLSYLFCFIA